MVNEIYNYNSSYNYNNAYYDNERREKEQARQRQANAELGFWVASVAAAGIRSLLPKFSNPFLKQMNKEHANNDLYKDAFFKSIDNSGLREKGLEFVNCEFIGNEEALYKAKHTVTDGDVKAGLNAYYSPQQKIVKLNKNKATISGFHELGHALNHLDSKFGQVLQKMRVPGYTIAGLMGTVALFSRTKPKGEKRNTFDFVQDNCGKIAFIAMLPTVAEEALASHKGIKLARQAGLSDSLVKNLKKFYGKALLSYAGYALITGLSVFAASKITEVFTRPKPDRDY